MQPDCGDAARASWRRAEKGRYGDFRPAARGPGAILQKSKHHAPADAERLFERLQPGILRKDGGALDPGEEFNFKRQMFERLDRVSDRIEAIADHDADFADP